MHPAARGGGAFAILIAMRLLRGVAGEDSVPAAAVVGQVVNGLTGKPVPDVRVAATELPERNDGVTTDAQGRFVLRDLPREPFVVTASADRWAGQLTGSGSYGQQAWSSPPRTLQIADGQILRGIVVPFWPDGVISGRVTDESGEPMAGAFVEEMRRSAGAGWTGSDFGRRVTTDDRGVYRFSHAPGSFLLAAITTELRARSIDGDPAGLRPFAFPDTFFPGVTNAADARPISLRPGEERTNVDFRLIALPAVRVSGIVSNAGAPAAGVSVRLESMGSVDGSPVPDRDEVVTDAAGRFSFPAVLPGDYQLSARSGSGCLNGDDDEREAVPRRLSVSMQEVAGLVLSMSPCPLLTGELRFQGARQPTQDEIDSIQIGAAPDGEVTPAGRFSSRVSPGRQELTVITPEPWTVRSITVDGRDATDRPIDVPPVGMHHVVVLLTDARSSLSCVVTPAHGEPRRPAWVYLFPVDESRRLDGPRPMRRVREEYVRDGSVTFDDVPPGEYFVVAVHGLAPGDWPAAGTMDRMEPRARRIVLGEGEHQQLALGVVNAASLPESRATFADERRLTWETLPLAAFDRASMPWPPAPRDPVIHGRVLVAGSDAPLAGATVILERGENPVVTMTLLGPETARWELFLSAVGPGFAATTISDESGRFVFADIAAGVYGLTAYRPPFAPGAFGAGRFPGPSMPVVIRTGERLPPLEIRMHPGASIGGLVADASGATLGRANVTLFRIDQTIQGAVVSGGPVEATDADDRGRYRFWGLPAGEYALEAHAAAARDNFPMTRAADIEDPFKSEPPARTAKYGTATYPAGFNSTSVPAFGMILVAGDDRTADLRIPVGSPLMVVGQRVTGYPQCPDVTGRVVFAAGSAPPPDLSSIVIVMKPLGALDASVVWRGSAIDASGRFRIKNALGGRYQWGVVASSPAKDDAGPVRRGGWIVTSVMVNGRESIDTGTHTADDGRLEDVVVTLSDRPGSVAGTVADLTGSAPGVPDGTYVVLCPAEAVSRLPQSPRVRVVKPDTDRHFAFEDLVPGVYLVATIADVPEGAWWDPVVLERLAASGTRIAVGPGARAVLQVR